MNYWNLCKIETNGVENKASFIYQIQIFYIVLVLVCVASCTPNVKGCIDKNNQGQIDSITIVYDRIGPEPVLWDQGVHYRDYISSREAFGTYSITLNDSSSICNVLGFMKGNKYYRPCYGRYLNTDFLLIAYKAEGQDTIALSCAPGIIQMKDTLYWDISMFQFVTDVIAKQDSIWLNNSFIGLQHQQFQFR